MRRYGLSFATTLLLLLWCRLGAAAPLDEGGEDSAINACSIEFSSRAPIAAAPSAVDGTRARPTVPDWVMLVAAAITAGVITGRRLRPPPP